MVEPCFSALGSDSFLASGLDLHTVFPNYIEKIVKALDGRLMFKDAAYVYSRSVGVWSWLFFFLFFGLWLKGVLRVHIVNRVAYLT